MLGIIMNSNCSDVTKMIHFKASYRQDLPLLGKGTTTLISAPALGEPFGKRKHVGLIY
jgi:hypothetical protein